MTESFARLGVPVETHNVELIRGLFSDTMTLDEPVALAHLDGDWYESTMTCLTPGAAAGSWRAASPRRLLHLVRMPDRGGRVLRRARRLPAGAADETPRCPRLTASERASRAPAQDPPHAQTDVLRGTCTAGRAPRPARHEAPAGVSLDEVMLEEVRTLIAAGKPGKALAIAESLHSNEDTMALAGS